MTLFIATTCLALGFAFGVALASMADALPANEETKVILRKPRRVGLTEWAEAQLNRGESSKEYLIGTPWPDPPAYSQQEIRRFTSPEVANPRQEFQVECPACEWPQSVFGLAKLFQASTPSIFVFCCEDCGYEADCRDSKEILDRGAWCVVHRKPERAE